MQQQEHGIPVLRFPEFIEKWKNVRFDNVGTVIRGASPRPKGDPRYYGGTVPRLMVEDVARDGKYVNPISDSLTEEGAQLSRFCSKGTLTIVCSGTAKTVGQAAFLAKDACIHDGFLALINIKEGYSQDFIYYVVQKFQEHSERMATHGGTFINLTTSILKDFTRGFPSYKEQQKIAAFLGAVDEKIGFLQDKKDLLEKYKKGCMQKLFSQEIRFTDDSGKAFPDWKMYELDELFSAQRGQGLSKGAIEENGENPCILYGELYTTYKEVITEVKSYTNEDSGKKSKKGDLLVPSSTTTTGIDLANVTMLPYDDVYLGGDITIMRSKKEVNSLFYAYYLTNYKKYEIAQHAQGSTIVHLYFDHFKKIKVDYPSPNEQKKIADFLSAIDDKIALVSEELEKAMLFKKGLLQQMFV